MKAIECNSDREVKRSINFLVTPFVGFIDWRIESPGGLSTT